MTDVQNLIHAIVASGARRGLDFDARPDRISGRLEQLRDQPPIASRTMFWKITSSSLAISSSLRLP